LRRTHPGGDAVLDTIATRTPPVPFAPLAPSFSCRWRVSAFADPRAAYAEPAHRSSVLLAPPVAFAPFAPSDSWTKRRPEAY